VAPWTPSLELLRYGTQVHLAPAHHPLSKFHTLPLEAGLTGSGEVVGCGDTGLDVDSCFFWDSKQPIAFDRSR
jgi:hypothetical protein